MCMKIPRKPSKIKTISLIVDNVRSSENVGSFFRTADAVGVDHIYLVGITPNPLDKFGRPDGKIAKTALGAEKDIAHSYVKTINPLIKKLKKEGYTIVALELDKKSIDYRELLAQKDLSEKLALIVGNEVTGIKQGVLKNANYIVQIPMRGNKESLNVSVSTGIMLYEMSRLW